MLSPTTLVVETHPMDLLVLTVLAALWGITALFVLACHRLERGR